MSQSVPITQRRLFASGAVLLMIASAYAFHRLDVHPLTGFALMMFGIAGVGLALRGTTSPGRAWDGADAEPGGIRIWPVPLVLGVACLLVTAEFSGRLLGIDYTGIADQHLQFALFSAGVILVALGATAPRLKDSPRADADSFPRRWAFGLLALITLIGLGLRLWQLETAVHHFVDEMNFAMAVHQMSIREYIPMMLPFSSVAAFPWIYPYWQSLGVEVFGPGLLALRLPTAIIGALNIPAMYLLATTLFDRRSALAGALLLATFPPHIHFSRLGMNNIADPLIGMLLLAFLARGLLYRRSADFALFGVMLGLTQYFYEGGRVLYPLLTLAWLGVLVLWRQVHLDRDLIRRLGFGLLIGVIVAGPVYYGLFARELPLFQRYATVGLGGSYHQILIDFNAAQTLEQHIFRPLLIYVHMPELSVFYGGRTALVLVFVVPFLLLGVALAVVRPRPVTLLLLMWVLATSAGSMVLANSAYAARYVVAFPALMLLVVAGLRFAVAGRGVVLLAAALILSAGQTGYYFGPHLEFYNRQLRPTHDPQDALLRSLDYPANWHVCIITDDQIDTGYLDGIRGYTQMRANLCYLTPEELLMTGLARYETRPTAFFVRPDDFIVRDAIEANERFNGPQTTPFASVPQDRAFLLYETNEEG